MLRLRPYNKNDAKTIMSWIKDEKSFYKWTAGVFENNESAYYCYKAIGFEDVSQNEVEKYNVMGEEWNCLELEIKL